jgi:hypothetical protein
MLLLGVWEEDLGMQLHLEAEETRGRRRRAGGRNLGLSPERKTGATDECGESAQRSQHQ